MEDGYTHTKLAFHDCGSVCVEWGRSGCVAWLKDFYSFKKNDKEKENVAHMSANILATCIPYMYICV